ncbi:MAG: lipopolysaccharide biosynthesis protein [Bacteroides sp.]|nr:lipopolysaccharide biosynthesis protein [Bacteroides sp.]
MAFSISNKRIAKNTLFLYFRMLFGICINLFTVRIIWQELGVEDYGIYNIVAGVVLMFQFLNSAMVSASQRYLAYAIGVNNTNLITQTFSSSIRVHYILALIIFIIAESIGLWFLNYKLNLPSGKLLAANWVYQASAISFIIMVISVPYNAAIVAYEDMKIFGIYGIIEVIFKFLAAIALIFIYNNKLIIYSLLLLAVSIVMRLLYIRYCKKHYNYCIYRSGVENGATKDMFSFAGWNLLGSFGVSAREQGLNIILNMFFNVVYNAAKGIANQVSGVVMGFTYNFQMSMFPQITKRYASGDIHSMLKLTFAGCQISYYLLLLLSGPIIFRANYILSLWLKDGVSIEMEYFLIIMLISLLIDSMKGPVAAALQATGKIKIFQIVIFTILISSLPIAWIWLRFVHDPYIVVYVTAITNLIALFARFYLLKIQIGLYGQGKQILWMAFQIIIVTALYFSITFFYHSIFLLSPISLIVYSMVSIFSGSILIYFFGLSHDLRKMISESIKAKLNKFSIS